MVGRSSNIESEDGSMMHVIQRPAWSFLELIEKLAMYALLSLVACRLIVVEGLTAMVAMVLRCIAIVLIGLGATALLGRIISMQPWASSGLPRGSVAPSRPGIEVNSSPEKRGATCGIGGDAVRVAGKV